MTCDRPLNVFVQGAARGIGLALARQLLDARAVERLFVSARDANASGLKRLSARGADKVCAFSLDITREASI